MISAEVYISVLLCFIVFSHFYNRLLVRKVKLKHKELREEIEILKALYFVKTIRDTGIDSFLMGPDSYDKEIVITLKSRKEFDSIFKRKKKLESKDLEKSIKKLQKDLNETKAIQIQQAK